MRWTNIQSTPGCFFFSGPGELGRDVSLGEQAEWVHDPAMLVLSFGDRVLFIGDSGRSPVVLMRHDTGVYGGKWQVVETLVGDLQQGLFRGRYQYHECEEGECRRGFDRCEITADVVVEPAPLR